MFVVLFLLSAKLTIPVMCACEDTSPQNLVSCAQIVEVEEDRCNQCIIGFMCEQEGDTPMVCIKTSACTVSVYLEENGLIKDAYDLKAAILNSCRGFEFPTEKMILHLQSSLHGTKFKVQSTW